MTSVVLAALLLALAAPPRLLVLTDIGGDPDDQQSLVRLLLYSHEFTLEGLIASAAGVPGELKEDVVRPDLIRETVQAYGRVRDRLAEHRAGYPPERDLLAVIRSGSPRRGVASLGEGKDTEGSRWIIRAADRHDPRPLNVAIWGGSTELAQALWRVRQDRGEAGVRKFLERLRVYAIGQQDDTGPWILKNFPDLFYLLGKAPDGRDKREALYRGMYLGGDESLTSRDWVDARVRTGHGPLGALYPPRTWTEPNPYGALKEGDTPSWFYFLPTGLSDPEHPEWGCWGGRFQPAGRGLHRDAADTVGGTTYPRVTVWRWRPAYQNDFQARMDWCVRGPKEANHPPVAGFRGDTSCEVIRLEARPGESIRLDANGSSDFDDDMLSYRWWVYREAGTYPGVVAIAGAARREAELRVPADASGRTVHVVLEVTDNGKPPLTRYRRIVINGR